MQIPWAGAVTRRFFRVKVPPDDWRRWRDVESYAGATWTWKNYQALSAQWEHEHCEFCWHKFLDPNYSPAHLKALDNYPDEHSPAGYTNLADDGLAPGTIWVCERCFADFQDECSWKVVPTDPDAWPYDGPEPEHHITVGDSTPLDRPWLRRPQ